MKLKELHIKYTGGGRDVFIDEEAGRVKLAIEEAEEVGNRFTGLIQTYANEFIRLNLDNIAGYTEMYKLDEPKEEIPEQDAEERMDDLMLQLSDADREILAGKLNGSE